MLDVNKISSIELLDVFNCVIFIFIDFNLNYALYLRFVIAALCGLNEICGQCNNLFSEETFPILYKFQIFDEISIFPQICQHVFQKCELIIENTVAVHNEFVSNHTS